MLKELYLNDQLCELSGNESIAVDYAIFNVDDIESRDGLRSYEFEIPKTNVNKQVLESNEVVSSLSTLPFSRIKARYYVDGVDTLVTAQGRRHRLIKYLCILNHQCSAYQHVFTYAAAFIEVTQRPAV